MTATDTLRAALTVEQLWQPTPGGSGTYVVELGNALRGVPDVRPTGIAAAHRGAPPPDWRTLLPVRHAPLPRRALYEAWQRAGLPRAEHVVPGVDVVHATTWAVPPTARPLVVTVHDVAFLHDPGHFTRRGNAYFRRALEHVRRRADAIVVPSASTAQDCTAAGIAAERITVVPHGVRVTRPTSARVTGLRRELGLTRDYVLWCGTVEPRKNLATLLTAFAGLGADVDLVLAGPAGWGRVPELPAGLRRDRVHVLGRLDREDLDTVYAGARAFCFPSIREGFGLPVLEAMAHGVPVVTSAGTACAEVAGDAAVLVPALDADAMTEGLARAVGPDHDDLVARGLRRASQFSWQAAADATAGVYRKVSGDR